MKKEYFLVFLLWQLCWTISSQQNTNSEFFSIKDSIKFYQQIGDYNSVNRLLIEGLHPSQELSLDEEFDFKVQLFSNQLSLRNYDLAFQYSAEIDSIIESRDHNFNLKNLGLYHHGKGVLNYRFGNNKTSIQSYLKAIEYRRKAFSEEDLSVIKSLKNLGHAYYESRDLKSAVKAFTQSIDNHLLRIHRDESMLQSTYSFLSNTYIEMNDLDKGWKYLQSSIVMAQGLFGENSIKMAELYSSDVFQYYAGINDIDGMITACKKAETILEKLDIRDHNVQSKLSNTFNNFAIAYERKGEINVAEKYYLKSSDINRQREDRIYYLIRNYLNLGSLCIDNNQYKKAGNYFSNVLNVLSPEIDSSAFGLYYYHVAELARHEKKYNQSESDFINSLKYFNAYDNLNLGSIKNGLPAYIEILFDYALLFDDQYKESENISHLYTYDSIYSKIDLGVQTIRKDFTSQESKLFLSSEVNEIYEHAISVYYTLFEHTRNTACIERAFDIIEKNKSLAILEELENRKLLLDTELPEQLLIKIEILEEEILQLNLQEQIESDPIDINERIIQADLELDNVYKEISITYPQYERLQFNNESIQLSEVQKLASKENVATIQYFLTDDYLYLMYVDEDDIEFNRLQVDSVFITDISTLRNLIDDSVDKVNFNYEERKQLFTDFLLTSKRLYQSLILPVESYLNETQNIVIIPDKQIGYIPFDVLSNTGSEADYLIHTYNITYAYSMGLYEWMVNTTHSSQIEKLLGFAPSFAESSTLSPLPFNKTEIDKIAGVLALDSRVDDDATKANFLDLCEDYSMIHLSTHGIVDHAKPSQSYIAFNEVSDSLDLQNSLYASEIFNLNSKAELLVLSACETAIGDIAEGEGIMSLSRAWAATGVKSIVSTLWRIDDQFTSDFMTEFYRDISHGASKSDALWNTKKVFLNNDVYHHPYYWASFTLMGDRGRLSFTNQTNYLKIGLLLVGAFLLLSLFYLFLKRFF